MTRHGQARRAALPWIALALGVALSGAAGTPGAAAPDEFARAVAAAMGPYYAALIASHRGDGESTQRHLSLLTARWERVAKTAPPEPLRQDPTWPAALDRIRAILARTQALVRARQLERAHLELEGLRLVLRDARGRHGLLVFDDYLTDYHEAMERIVVRASMQNEIVLAEADYGELARDLGRARAHWAVVEREAGPIAATAGWPGPARRITELHAALERHVTARDAAAVARDAVALRDAYHDLLAVLARAPRE
jgi:hypothetical protein